MDVDALSLSSNRPSQTSPIKTSLVKEHFLFSLLSLLSRHDGKREVNARVHGDGESKEARERVRGSVR